MLFSAMGGPTSNPFSTSWVPYISKKYGREADGVTDALRMAEIQVLKRLEPSYAVALSLRLAVHGLR